LSRARVIADLCAALAGRPRREADWMAVLELANTALVTPEIWAATVREARIGGMPSEVARFARETRRRNFERNRRLFNQLADAVSALERAGVEPVLLKGAGVWASLGRPEPFERMLNDLELLIEPAHAERAVSALMAKGFTAVRRSGGPHGAIAAGLARPDRDVGFVDLHLRPPGPPPDPRSVAEPPPLGRLSRRYCWRGLTLRAPLPAAQIYFGVLQDQFHAGGYWQGGFSLRRLKDIADLSRGPEPVDWTLLRSLSPTRLVRDAVAAQLLAARRFFGADVPSSETEGLAPLLIHARHMAQFRWPRLVVPLGTLAILCEARALTARPHARRPVLPGAAPGLAAVGRV
jgi:hypothetical protein